MIDVARPKLYSEEDCKITINDYKNPYITKLTLKVLPQYSDIKDSTVLLPPYKKPVNFSIVQSLPLWRNEKFRIGLLWQQNIRGGYNRTHLGFSTEYKVFKSLSIKSKNMFGSSFITVNELNKEINLKNRPLQLTGVYSLFLESWQKKLQSYSAGISYNNQLAVSVSQRLGYDLTFRTNYQTKVYRDFYLKLQYEAETSHIEESTFEASIGYEWGSGISAWIKTVLMNKSDPNLCVEVEKKIKGHSFIANIQYKSEKSILYFGYKCPSFNIVLPVYGSESFLPTLVGGILYLIGYFIREKPKFERIEKAKSSRSDELKLISDKANENYKREEAQKGLLIEEVFIGEKKLLERFMKQENKFVELLRKEEYQNGIFDCTVSFRFYVNKGQLIIPKGKKISLLGCYYEKNENQKISIAIKYSKGGENIEAIYKEEDPISI